MRDPSHILGIDDAPLSALGARGRAQAKAVGASASKRGNVLVVGAMFAGPRLEGVLSTHVRRDGRNATRAITQMIERSQFAEHAQLIMLQGIAVGGFNVIDVATLSKALTLPVLVIARRQPRLDAIRAALQRLPDGERKWTLIEAAGPMEPLSGVWVQRVGIDRDTAKRVIARFAIAGSIPEPLRVAHLIAGGVTTGKSRGRV